MRLLGYATFAAFIGFALMACEPEQPDDPMPQQQAPETGGDAPYSQPDMQPEQQFEPDEGDDEPAGMPGQP